MEYRILHLSVCFFCLFSQVFYQDVNGDIFMHAPRGSNNRLNAAQKNRANNNRVFDSQNNAKGGYNAGEKTQKESTKWNEMQYFMSGTRRTILPIEWTNQHGCGDRDLNCNIVLQYKCQKATDTIDDDVMRNGKTEQTQDYNKVEFNDKASKDTRKANTVRDNRVLNEPWEWYDKCAKRDRNKGLFTADQNLNGDASIHTRQNSNGARSGYECPEERDYYPYWHPTDWIDIVMFGERIDCRNIRWNSFNRRLKGECLEKYPQSDTWKHASKFNNEAECTSNNGKWVNFYSYLEILDKPNKTECFNAIDELNRQGNGRVFGAWGIPYRSEDIDKFQGDPSPKCLITPPPVKCGRAPHSRANHPSNGYLAQPLKYNWDIPYFPSGQEQRCVLRIRYNISINDFNPRNTFADSNNDKDVIENNPEVDIGKEGNNKVPVQLAINTAQFGRTFQDRSHTFKIIPRPEHVRKLRAHILNVNVRGKRGNIVQAFPAVEYDFTPNRFIISRQVLLHFQWEGSNTNPPGNAGQGRKKTDRSNIVAMARSDKSYPLEGIPANSLFDENKLEVIHALGGAATKTAADAQIAMATGGHFATTGDVPSPFQVAGCNAQQAEELDCYPPSWPGLLVRLARGRYSFMCSRNNNFTNRGQKGYIVVR